MRKNILYYGHPDPLQPAYQLSAGPVTARFETGDGFLRSIHCNGVEILRGVYSAVRDHNWDTIPAYLSNLKIEIADSTFHVSFEVNCNAPHVDFYWEGNLFGSSDGTIAYRMNGVARKAFRRNRIGFCVLHPMECAGKPITVEHADGNATEGAFPTTISPHQPFFNIQTIIHKAATHLKTLVRFEGEVFEMEDQRNWSDASYKSYCTPLSLPFPAEVKEGDKVQQTVTIQPIIEESKTSVEILEPAPYIEISVDDKQGWPLPQIGLGDTSIGQPLSGEQIKRLSNLHPGHIRVDLNLSDNGYQETLKRVWNEAQQLDCALELALFVSDDCASEIYALCDTLKELQPELASFTLFHQNEKSTSEQWIDLARPILKSNFPEVPFGSGTNAYFTELNRERPAFDKLDFTSWSINPQVHAFDNLSLTETLSAQKAVAESAKDLAPNIQRVVSPVTLKPRFNPNATGPEPEPEPGELPSQVDVRQMSLFGAGWTLGSIKYLSEGEIERITYFETIGWRGVMECENGPPVPGKFHSIPGGVFPLYHVLADVGDFRGGSVLHLSSSGMFQVDGMVLQKGDALRILLANYTNQCQHVRIQCDAMSEYVLIRSLDETNAESAMKEPMAFRNSDGQLTQTQDNKLHLSLLPYAVVRIDNQKGGS